MKADILLDIFYDVKDPTKTVIRTNARREALEEIFEAWVQDQVGRGPDPRTPERRDMYRIIIGLDMDGDVFATNSDTGNHALTAGIVADVMGNLDTVCVTPPSSKD